MINTSELRINAKRFESNFKALSQIGATPDGGVHRPAFSQSHLAARAWFKGKIEAAGLEFHEDAAGNTSGVLNCGDPDASTLLLGSHLDSVPQGGRFDGALGVLAALEVLETIKEAGVDLPINLEAIDFSDEEGAHFGLLGSTALAGLLTSEHLEHPRSGWQIFRKGLRRASLDSGGIIHAARDPESLAGYLELHIEQGDRLIQTQAQIGLVTSIVGLGSYRITFTGRADHAGTTSMANRLDAAQGAAAFVMAARRLVLEELPDCVANVGRMELKPGAYNIIPEHAILGLEYRAPDVDSLNQVEAALLDLAQREADCHGLGLQAEFLGREEPARMSETAKQSIQQAAIGLELETLPLISYAGHDAQSLARICPAGMIFIPSIGGASHSSREFSAWHDCLNGANVLLHSALNFVDQLDCQS